MIFYILLYYNYTGNIILYININNKQYYYNVVVNQ